MKSVKTSVASSIMFQTDDDCFVWRLRVTREKAGCRDVEWKGIAGSQMRSVVSWQCVTERGC
jgi:hypothetical protein